MCGIAGFAGDNRSRVLVDMLNRIAHRGPDDSGCRLTGDVGLGNVRLSIMDPAHGRQPMSDPNDTCTLVYNGEIYGYRRTREELAREGVVFRSSSDTEVIIPLYQKYGMSFLDHLNGMFAFALQDHRTGTLILARDPFGIKPLVYTQLGNALYFASESKAFYAVPEWTPTPDREAWHAFMNIRFTPSPRTLFQGVFKIPPGCYLLLHPRASEPVAHPRHSLLSRFEFGEWQGRLCRYYKLPDTPLSIASADAEMHTRRLLESAVAEQLVADVDLGLYLSGGLDSSTLTALAARTVGPSLMTMCLGFNEPSDENADAAVVARHFGTRHQDVFLSEQPLACFQDALLATEEPKVNCLQGYLLSREARKHQKVVLSGLGGDELFGGYDVYALATVLDLAGRHSIRNALTRMTGRAARTLLRAVPAFPFDNARRAADILGRLNDPLEVYLLLRNAWDHDPHLRSRLYADPVLRSSGFRTRDLLDESFPDSGSLCRSIMQFEFENKMVDDFLANEDRVSMAHGLEVRVPFLDRPLVEFVHSLPTALKIRLGERKILLRRCMRDLLPEATFRKRKHGFTFDPVLQYQKDLGQYARKYLSRERVEASGFFRFEFIQTLLEAEPHPALRWHYFLLWQILGYHLWEDVFIHRKGRIG